MCNLNILSIYDIYPQNTFCSDDLQNESAQRFLILYNSGYFNEYKSDAKILVLHEFKKIAHGGGRS